MRPNTASDTTQKQDVLQIIAIMKNSDVGIFNESRTFLRQDVIKHVIHGHRRYYMPWFTSKALKILFLKFMLKT